MFKTILVPVDSAMVPDPALEGAIDYSIHHGSKIIGLSVASPRHFHSTEATAVNDGEAVEAENRAMANEFVAKVASAAAVHDVPCETVVSQTAFLSGEIIDVAARYHCDAIFMASRGRIGVVDTILQESETQKVLRKASIPVLVFPQPDKSL